MTPPRMPPTSQSAPRAIDKHRVIEHYDVVSPFYRTLWGEHLHHGYWITGNESKEQAQLQLTQRLAGLANIQPGSEILDIGCGFGGSSLYLARHYQAKVTGITISSVQVEMAAQAAKEQGLDANFLLMDAEAITLQNKFDLLWSVESISHYLDRPAFFTSAAKLLKPGGSFALTDWFKKENLTPAQISKTIEPIERGMFVELHTMDDYQSYLSAAGLRVQCREVLNKQCAKTWDISLDIIKDKKFWALAAQYGNHFLTYLHAFHALREGFSTGNFVYGLFVATSNPGSS